MYLGDSVYAEFDDDTGMIVLTTNNGTGPSNTIYLEPEVVEAFERFVEALRDAAREARERERPDAGED